MTSPAEPSTTIVRHDLPTTRERIEAIRRGDTLHRLFRFRPTMEGDSSTSGSSGSSGNGVINNDDDDSSFLANAPALLNPWGDDYDSDDDEDDFLLNNDDDIGSSNEGVYINDSVFFDTSMEEHDTGLVPIFDIKAHEAGGRDIADLAYLSTLSNVRKERWQHQRLVWENHLQLIFHEETFNNEYRMSYGAFSVRIEILQPILQRNANKCIDSEPIMTEHIMAMGLRYLAGGRVLDNRRFIGMDKSAAYSAVDDFINVFFDLLFFLFFFHSAISASISTLLLSSSSSSSSSLEDVSTSCFLFLARVFLDGESSPIMSLSLSAVLLLLLPEAEEVGGAGIFATLTNSLRASVASPSLFWPSATFLTMV